MLAQPTLRPPLLHLWHPLPPEPPAQGEAHSLPPAHSMEWDAAHLVQLAAHTVCHQGQDHATGPHGGMQGDRPAAPHASRVTIVLGLEQLLLPPPPPPPLPRLSPVAAPATKQVRIQGHVLLYEGSAVLCRVSTELCTIELLASCAICDSSAGCRLDRQQQTWRLTSATANPRGVASAASETPASTTTFVPGGVCCSTSATTLAACKVTACLQWQLCRRHGSQVHALAGCAQHCVLSSCPVVGVLWHRAGRGVVTNLGASERGTPAGLTGGRHCNIASRRCAIARCAVAHNAEGHPAVVRLREGPHIMSHDLHTQQHMC